MIINPFHLKQCVRTFGLLVIWDLIRTLTLPKLINAHSYKHFHSLWHSWFNLKWKLWLPNKMREPTRHEFCKWFLVNVLIDRPLDDPVVPAWLCDSFFMFLHTFQCRLTSHFFHLHHNIFTQFGSIKDHPLMLNHLWSLTHHLIKFSQ